MFIVLAILIFSFFIFIHELGHYIAAVRAGVKVEEFAFGMGPKIWSKKGKETVFAIRLLPFGGACVMQGEDADADGNPVAVAGVTANGQGEEKAEEVKPFDKTRSFSAKTRRARAVILVAGAFMNLITGFVIIAVLNLTDNSEVYVKPTVTAISDWSVVGGDSGIQVGDEIYSINDKRVYYIPDFNVFTAIPSGADGVVDLVLVRDGKKLTYKDFALRKVPVHDEKGNLVERFGLSFTVIPVTLGGKITHAFYDTWNDVRLVGLGLEMIFSGETKFSDLSGPIGIVDIINETGKPIQTDSETGEVFAVSLSNRIRQAFTIAAFLTVNLAVMNLLPIPALDGGRVFALPITWAIEKVRRRPVNPKYEGYVHAIGMLLLLALMVVVLVSDVWKIVH
ncbi:MAG: site-2 protease family protein [Oscillospiraceae bacterium]|jgi:regulator of sigma E protease|nr:site-2 protease family protein [Oscillospiraceae bacterium]